MRALAFFLFISCSCVPLAYAEHDDPIVLLHALKTESKSNRIIIAKELKSIYEYIDLLVPSLKPADIAWVRKEESAVKQLLNISMKEHARRRLALEGSYEYNVNFIKQRLKIILYLLGEIVDNKQPVKNEVGLWAELVYWITEDTNAIDNAFHHLVLDNKLELRQGSFSYPVFGAGHDYWMYQIIHANKIQGSIVVGYFKGQIN